MVIKRLFDFLSSLIFLIVISPLLIIIAIAVRIESKGPAIYWSKRVGRNNVLFNMPKFRTMKLDTPQVATHLLNNSDSHITKLGSFLRKTSLDEFPQLWSIIKGDMSVVGPRPALFNQHDLIALREKDEIHKLAPGLTGLAQVSGRDEIPLTEKVKFDKDYLNKQSFYFDLKIIYLTIIRVLGSRDISH